MRAADINDNDMILLVAVHSLSWELWQCLP